MWFEAHELEKILQKVVDIFLIPRFNELGMNATGEWIESIDIEVGNDSGKIRGRNYSEQLAKGRGPGKMPSVDKLEKWVNVKLGLHGGQGLSVAWAIAKKIQREGTSWYQKGGSDLIEVLSDPKTIEFMQQELIAIAKVRIAETLQRNTQNIFS